MSASVTPLLPSNEVIGWYPFITDVCYSGGHYMKACLVKNKYRFVEKGFLFPGYKFIDFMV